MTNRKLQLFLILLITFVAFVVNNGAIEANIMEARNLTTAREMLEENNWLEPTMNGELRLEKPPLPTWIAAVMMKLGGGENLSLLRLPSALAGFLMIFFICQLTSQISDDRLLRVLVAGTSATSFYIFFLARDISWDIFCHAFMIGAISLIHKGMKGKDEGWSPFLGAGVLMGLSFLSKGPVSFYALLLPYLIARSYTYGWEGANNKKWGLFAMALIALVLSFWWPLYIWFTHPEFSALIAKQESLAWLERSTRPFYHYWSFPIQSGIWTVFAAIALVFPYARQRIDKFGNYGFLFIWVVSAVLLLSLFPEKKERYLLPVLLPLAILTAFYFRYLIDAFSGPPTDKTDRILFWINALLMILICVAMPVVLIFLPIEKEHVGFGYLLINFILFWGLALLLISAFRMENPFRLWMGMVGMVLSVCLSLLPLVSQFVITNPEYHSYQELRHRNDLQGIPFFFNGEIPGKFIEVIWNSGHKVKKWDPAIEQQLPANPPLLLFSHEHPFDVLPATILKNYHIKVIGHFDGNPGKRGGNKVLSNFATVIE